MDPSQVHYKLIAHLADIPVDNRSLRRSILSQIVLSLTHSNQFGLKRMCQMHSELDHIQRLGSAICRAFFAVTHDEEHKGILFSILLQVRRSLTPICNI
jgi:hypothetical protein